MEIVAVCLRGPFLTICILSKFQAMGKCPMPRYLPLSWKPLCKALPALVPLRRPVTQGCYNSEFSPDPEPPPRPFLL